MRLTKRLILLTSFCAAIFILFSFFIKVEEHSWIRVNLLGYQPKGVKVAVWCSKVKETISEFNLVEATSGKVVYRGKAGKDFGAYGPFAQVYRLRFSNFSRPGRYYLEAGAVHSPEFVISDTAYGGAADFCLRYMRQQRCGYNPFLHDSCHTHDG